MIKLLDILKEIKINKPHILWDFTKYIPNFNPDNIQVGDEILLKPFLMSHGENNVRGKVFDINDDEISPRLGRRLHYSTNISGNHLAYFDELIRQNNKNK